MRAVAFGAVRVAASSRSAPLSRLFPQPDGTTRGSGFANAANGLSLWTRCCCVLLPRIEGRRERIAGELVMISQDVLCSNYSVPYSGDHPRDCSSTTVVVLGEHQTSRSRYVSVSRASARTRVTRPRRLGGVVCCDAPAREQRGFWVCVTPSVSRVVFRELVCVTTGLH